MGGVSGMLNPTLKMRETFLFFLIVMINGLICIDSDIRLNTYVRERWREEVSKMEMNQPLDPLLFSLFCVISMVGSLEIIMETVKIWKCYYTADMAQCNWNPSKYNNFFSNHRQQLKKVPCMW